MPPTDPNRSGTSRENVAPHTHAPAAIASPAEAPGIAPSAVAQRASAPVPRASAPAAPEA